MIELENLHNRSLDDILDEYLNKIPYFSTEWTDYQEADPGITLVELFSWLKWVQHEYLNREVPGVSTKFLRLLDVNRYKNKGAKTFLEVSHIKENTDLPVRTQWKSGNMVFENTENQTLINSSILNIEFDNPEMPSQEEYYKFDGNNVFYVFGKNTERKETNSGKRRFIISFDAPIPQDKMFNIFFSVYNSHDLKRNPIKESDKFVPMAKIKWEYYGIKDGNTGWHEINVIKDYTYEFLFPGIIEMKIDGTTEPIDGEYKIRATLIYDEYDYPPRIDNVITNVFSVTQNETKCENTIIKKQDIFPDFSVEVPRNLALYGRSEVYLRSDGGWVRTSSPTFKSFTKKGKLTVDLSEVWDEIKNLKPGDDAVMIVSYDQDFKDSAVLGSGTGITNQTFKFEFKNVLYNDLELLISEKINGKEVFFKWKRVDDFYSSGKYDRHFVYDENEKVIIFGDHEHGMAPQLGNNNIIICGLRFTSGYKSNIKENMISSVITRNNALSNSRISQIKEAAGGRDTESIEHASARAAEIFSNPHRAVSKKDYENIVKNTPGLMFSNVKILPNYMPGEDTSKQNCITIAVRWNRKVGLTLPKSFEQNIMNHINKYRLINTRIKVISPEYIGLIISGKIVVDSFYREEDKIIEKEIKRFIKNMNEDLGKTLHFGDVFGMIDKLKYVSRLDNLRIVPVGNFIQKNVSEDIIIPPNGVYYVEKIDFNYIKNSEIYKG